MVLARSFGTIGNGPIPQDVIQTVPNASGSAMLTLAVADSAASVFIFDQTTGCASLAPVVNPTFITCTPNCVKPDAGKDSTYACVNNQLPTSFNLKDAQAGQKWKIISPVPAGASIAITTPAGLVTGTIVAGTYKFLLQTQSDSIDCRDTVQIVVQPCTTGAQIALRPKAYLQGALYGVFLPDTLMRDDLRTLGYLPTTSPYPGMGMTGLTSANTSSTSVLGASGPAGKDAIVDWMFIELRSATDTVTVVDSRSALLQRDGDIVDVDGTSPLLFSVATAGNYFIVVKHRNHLSVMSKNAVALSSTPNVVDFRKASIPVYSSNSVNPINTPRVTVQQGMAMWAGNVLYTNMSDGKRSVIFQGADNDINVIYQQIINAPANTLVTPAFKLKGYFPSDVTLNGEAIFQGGGNDVEFIYQNVINHPGNTSNLPFFIIKEQIK